MNEWIMPITKINIFITGKKIILLTQLFSKAKA